jgi:GTPase-activating protein BEM2
LRKIYFTAQPAGSSPSVSDHLLVARTRNEVLVTIQDWLTIGGGAQDILDDVQLFNAIQSFFENQTEQYMVKSDDNPIAVEQAWLSLVETKRSLKLTFMSQIMRPTISRGFHTLRPQGNNRGARRRNISTRDPPDLDRMDPEDFVDNLDGMAGATFSNVTQEVCTRDPLFVYHLYLSLYKDLYITADLLEVQTSDRTGWFSSRDVSSIEESVEIQTVYSHIQEIEPSSMISELTQDALYRLLPPGVRSCIRAYGIIRKWLISKIVAPRLGLRTRQARMELLIQAIEVSRLRNSDSSSTAQLLEQPCIRSFVEAVTTSALLSVESRMHHRAWQGVALSRGCSSDSLSSLLLRPYIQCTSSNDSLTVDMGWLLERMLEVIATPDIIEPSCQEGQTLVNFDKRRLELFLFFSLPQSSHFCFYFIFFQASL